MSQMILYGAGELGILAKKFFNFYNIDTKIVDDNPKKITDTFWKNYDIFPLEGECSSSDHLVVVCISTHSYNDIKEKLENKGFKNIKPFFEVAEQINKKNGYRHPLTNGWVIKNNTKRFFKKVHKVYSFFKDFHSGDNYFDFFIWHRHNKEITSFYVHPINCDNRYFIPEVTEVLHDNEEFIDIGAYDGRVSEKFMKITNNKYKNIYCFEPDVNSYMKIANKNLGIVVLRLAFGNKTGEINFNEDDSYLSKVDKKSKNKVPITKLDIFKSINPTFIKYHVEGYELEAIKGSIKTIKRCRPIVAVTTYHTEEGLYKLPLYLIKHLKDYDFYWRNHNYMGQGSVMYCIPKERKK